MLNEQTKRRPGIPHEALAEMSDYTKASIQFFAALLFGSLIGLPIVAYFSGLAEPGSAIDTFKKHIEEIRK